MVHYSPNQVATDIILNHLCLPIILLKIHFNIISPSMPRSSSYYFHLNAVIVLFKQKYYNKQTPTLVPEQDELNTRQRTVVP